MSNVTVKRTMVIEFPDDVAEVDFIDRCLVTIELSAGVLTINVKATHGPDSSSWDEHDFEVVLPKHEAGG